MSLPSVQLGCGGFSGHRSAPGGASNTTSRAGSPWWSSGGTTRIKRAPPAGRPSRATAGTNPKTGGHQPKDWQALPFNDAGDLEFFLAFSKCVSKVVRGSFICVGIHRYWAPYSYRSLLLLPSLLSSLALFSDVVPFTFLPSSLLLDSDRPVRFPKLFQSEHRDVRLSAWSLLTERAGPGA